MQQVLSKFGQKVREIRQKRNYTIEEFAEYLQYSPNHISKIESARTKPSFELIIKIAEVLDVDIQELFNFQEQKSNAVIKKKLNNIMDKSNSKDLNLIYKIINTVCS